MLFIHEHESLAVLLTFYVHVICNSDRFLKINEVSIKNIIRRKIQSECTKYSMIHIDLVTKE